VDPSCPPQLHAAAGPIGLRTVRTHAPLRELAFVCDASARTGAIAPVRAPRRRRARRATGGPLRATTAAWRPRSPPSSPSPRRCSPCSRAAPAAGS
jgi:hypothetical protein